MLQANINDVQNAYCGININMSAGAVCWCLCGPNAGSLSSTIPTTVTLPRLWTVRLQMRAMYLHFSLLHQPN